MPVWAAPGDVTLVRNGVSLATIYLSPNDWETTQIPPRGKKPVTTGVLRAPVEEFQYHIERVSSATARSGIA